MRCIALERAVRPMARAYEALHLHVLARQVVDGGIFALLELDRVPAVGDDLALERHAHALLRGLGLDVMHRILLEPGSGIASRRFHRKLRSIFFSSWLPFWRASSLRSWRPSTGRSCGPRDR